MCTSGGPSGGVVCNSGVGSHLLVAVVNTVVGTIENTTVTIVLDRNGLVVPVRSQNCFQSAEMLQNNLLPNVETKLSRINVAVTPDQQGAEDRLGQDVENTIKNGLGIGRDDIATLAETPGNRVDEPEENGPGTDKGVGCANILTKGQCVCSTDHNHIIGNEEESKSSKDKVSPLVR